jgi:hypothetical protein
MARSLWARSTGFGIAVASAAIASRYRRDRVKAEMRIGKLDRRSVRGSVLPDVCERVRLADAHVVGIRARAHSEYAVAGGRTQ